MAADASAHPITKLPLVATAAQHALRNLETTLDAVWEGRLHTGALSDLPPHETLALLDAQETDLRTLTGQVAQWQRAPQDSPTTEVLSITETTLVAALAVLDTLRAVVETMDPAA